jgi:predicted permease
MLLSTAGLLVKSFARLQEQNPGFNPEGVITARLDLPTAKYDRPEKMVAFHDAAVAAVRALPGVTAVGMTSLLPFSGDNSQSSYVSPEIQLPAGAPEPHAQVRRADPGYLHALGIILVRGRWFSDGDAAGAPHVAVIDRVLAERYWPGQEPLGKHLSLDSSPAGATDLWTIVGIVAPVKVRNLEEIVAKETIYFPFAQLPGTGLTLVVRAARNPAGLAASLRAAVRTADPEQPVFDLQTMVQRMDNAAQPRRAPMMLLALFSGVALLLASLGVYGVLAFFVVQRTSEIGIRLALGATTRDIVVLVLGQGTRLVVVGLAAGLGGYLALSHLIGELLFGVAATDPAMLALAPAVLAVVALAACLVPVRRATRIDPLVALRAE